MENERRTRFWRLGASHGPLRPEFCAAANLAPDSYVSRRVWTSITL